MTTDPKWPDYEDLPKALGINNDVVTAVGQLSVAFSYMEEELNVIVGALLGIKHAHAMNAVAHSIRDFSARVRMVAAVGKITLNDPED